MLRKEISYTNFNGDPVTRAFYFNLSEAELVTREASSDGTFAESLKAIAESNKGSVILPEFEKLLKWTYGVKSADGERFVKNDEVWDLFQQSPAYSELIMEFFTDENAAANFINAVMPERIVAARKQQQAQDGFRPGAPTLPQSRIDQLEQTQPMSPPAVQDFQPPVEVAPTDTAVTPQAAPQVQDFGGFGQTSTPRYPEQQ